MTCIKCESQDIYRVWHRHKWDCGYSSKGFQFDGEHLHHHCRGCSYEWPTPTADASKAEGRG